MHEEYILKEVVIPDRTFKANAARKTTFEE